MVISKCQVVVSRCQVVASMCQVVISKCQVVISMCQVVVVMMSGLLGVLAMATHVLDVDVPGTLDGIDADEFPHQCSVAP